MGKYLDMLQRARPQEPRGRVNEHLGCEISENSEKSPHAGDVPPRGCEQPACPDAPTLAHGATKPQGELSSEMQPQAHATMRDIPFPSGYRGLPLEPVALGLRVMDALAEQHPVLRDPVLRKFNVLGFVTSWLLDRYQNRQTAAFDDPEIAQLYEGVKAERSRLAATFPPESRQPHANGHRRL